MSQPLAPRTGKPNYKIHRKKKKNEQYPDTMNGDSMWKKKL